MGNLCRACLLLCVGLALVEVAAAQPGGLKGGLDRDRPSERPLPSVPPLPAEPPPQLELPPLPEPSEEGKDRLSAAPQVVLREIRVTGSTVFTPEELAAKTEPFLNRPNSSEDLLALADALTRLYVDHGYVNSGAVIPDQKVEDGTLEIRIIEGSLENIEIEGNEWFMTSALRRRLARGASVPLDVNRIVERLQLLQADSRIERIEAELVPGSEPGKADLRVRVEDNQPFHLTNTASNEESPSIGAYRNDVTLVDDNVIGLGDRFSFDFGITEGLHEYDGSYEIPFTPWDTRFLLYGSYSDSKVIEEPFDEIDITSTSSTFGVGISQSVYETVNSSVTLFLLGELRTSKTYLDGRPFSFSLGPEDGRSRVVPLRFGQEWIYRDEAQVWTARSTFSFGLDVLGATPTNGSAPGGRFQAWLIQLQWVRRFESLYNTELILRAEAQLTTRPLLSLEQFAFGGLSTVRGYRENEVVCDYGVVSSIEARVPVWRGWHERILVQLAPFVDFGKGFNLHSTDPPPDYLASVGIGLRASIFPWLQAEIYYGYRLQKVPIPSDRDLQDEGVSFRVTVFPF